MPNSRQCINYDVLPDFETVEDAAFHVLEMIGAQGDYYQRGILKAFYAASFTGAQFGLIEKFSSAQLSQKLEKLLGEANPKELPEHLEKAFWTPLFASAKQILNPRPEDNVDARTATPLYASIMLYATLDASICNMRLIMRSASAKQDLVDSQNDFGRRDDREVYTDMPAEQTLHVLKRGFLPQLKKAICNQFGVDDAKFVKMVRAVKNQWDEGYCISQLDFIKPIDPVEWMKHGRLHPDIAAIEEIQALEDFSITHIPPERG